MTDVEKLELWAESMGRSTSVVQDFLDNFSEGDADKLAADIVAQLERMNPNAGLY